MANSLIKLVLGRVHSCWPPLSNWL